MGERLLYYLTPQEEKGQLMKKGSVLLFYCSEKMDAQRGRRERNHNWQESHYGDGWQSTKKTVE